MADILEAAGVSRRFGWRWALRRVDLALERGQRVAIVGENGSGKTTFLRVVSGLLRPNEGEVRLGGSPVSALNRSRIGLLVHEPFLYPALTLRENLGFFAKLFRLTPGAADEKTLYLAGILGLEDRLDEPVQTLSQGLCQRAALARAMLHEPEFFLLDEPFAGLDQSAAEGLEAILRNISEGAGFQNGAPRSLLFTDHDIPRALGLADWVVVLSKGEAVFRAASAETSAGEVSGAMRAGGK
jgi:ABC-type multidrug transport system ATPase subunit